MLSPHRANAGALTVQTPAFTGDVQEAIILAFHSRGHDAFAHVVQESVDVRRSSRVFLRGKSCKDLPMSLRDRGNPYLAFVHLQSDALNSTVE